VFKPRVLALIPARGGSKGLPGKNLRLLAGKPLLVWSIEQGLATPEIARVVVSTDDSKVAAVARDSGADVPFLRPAEISGDAAPTSATVIHALDFLAARGVEFDAVLLLEPTSPLRASGDLSGAIRVLSENWDRADSVVSVGAIHTESPFVSKTISPEGFVVPLLPPSGVTRRQDLPTAYFPYGVAYLTKVSAFRTVPTFYQKATLPFLIERWQNFEIDDATDFVCVEAVMRARGLGEL
jgi:CMP-N,N'-diacetyllegionaminic acid synthase